MGGRLPALLLLAFAAQSAFGEPSSDAWPTTIDIVAAIRTEVRSAQSVSTGDIRPGDRAVLMGGGSVVGVALVTEVSGGRLSFRPAWVNTNGSPVGQLTAAVLNESGFGRVASQLTPPPVVCAWIDAPSGPADAGWARLDTRFGWTAGELAARYRGDHYLGPARVTLLENDVGQVVSKARRYDARILVSDRLERLAPGKVDEAAVPINAVWQTDPSEDWRIELAFVPTVHSGAHFDVYRASAFIGAGRLLETRPGLPDGASGPGRQAEVFEAMVRMPPAPGDRVVFRPPFEPGASRMGHLFRVEGDYGLATLGESDGVTLGQSLVCRLAGEEVRLVVRHVYPDHCAVEIAESDVGRLPLWAAVHTISSDAEDAAQELAIPAELIPHPAAEWLFVAAFPPGEQWRKGDPVLLDAERRRLGVVVARSEEGKYVVARLRHWRL